MARHKKSKRRGENSVERSLDYHEGLSVNQVKIILREFSLYHLLDEFNEWMRGQTVPVITRPNKEDGKEEKIVGVYEYDLFRFIRSKRTGIPPIFD